MHCAVDDGSRVNCPGHIGAPELASLPEYIGVQELASLPGHIGVRELASKFRTKELGSTDIKFDFPQILYHNYIYFHYNYDINKYKNYKLLYTYN